MQPLGRAIFVNILHPTMAKALENTEQQQEEPGLKTNIFFTNSKWLCALWAFVRSPGGRKAGGSPEVTALGRWAPVGRAEPGHLGREAGGGGGRWL